MENKDIKMHIPQAYTHSMQEHHHTGIVLGILVLLLVLIFGGLYLWGGMLTKEVQAPVETPLVNHEPETVRANADVEIIKTTSPSDDISAIEADLNSTNLDMFRSDMNAIDAEINGAG